MENSKENGKKKVTNEDLEKAVGGATAEELERLYEEKGYLGVRVRIVGGSRRLGEIGRISRIIKLYGRVFVRVLFPFGSGKFRPEELEVLD